MFKHIKYYSACQHQVLLAITTRFIQHLCDVSSTDMNKYSFSLIWLPLDCFVIHWSTWWHSYWRIDVQTHLESSNCLWWLPNQSLSQHFWLVQSFVRCGNGFNNTLFYSFNPWSRKISLCQHIDYVVIEAIKKESKTVIKMFFPRLLLWWKTDLSFSR